MSLWHDSRERPTDKIRDTSRVYAEKAFGSGYRGYTFRGLNWASEGTEFGVYAYCPNSPLHPNDMVYWKADGVNNMAAMGAIIENAILSLKNLIDLAHDAPASFRAVEMVADE